MNTYFLDTEFIKRSALILLFMVLLFSVSAQVQEKEELERQAMLRYQDKEYAQAVVLYEDLLHMDYKNSYYLNQCGICYFHQEEFEKAKEKFRMATLYGDVDDKKTMALYYSNLSAAYSNLNEDEKAYGAARKAYQMHAGSMNGLWNAASLAQNLGRYQDCLKLMDESQLGELHNAFRTLYGRCYFNTQQYAKAKDVYKTFFNRYDPADDFVKLHIDQEKDVYVKAFLHWLSVQDDELLIRSEIKKMKTQFPDDKGAKAGSGRAAIFASEEHVCALYNISDETCALLFDEMIENPSPEETLYYLFYVKKDYEEAYKQAARLLKGAQAQQVKSIRFFSALHLFLADYVAKKTTADEKKLEQTARHFKELFDPQQVYTAADFSPASENFKLLKDTFGVFRMHFHTPSEQQQGALLLESILKYLPNPQIKDEIMGVLRKGN